MPRKVKKGGAKTEEEKLLYLQQKAQAEEEMTKKKEEILTLFLKVPQMRSPIIELIKCVIEKKHSGSVYYMKLLCTVDRHFSTFLHSGQAAEGGAKHCREPVEAQRRLEVHPTSDSSKWPP